MKATISLSDCCPRTIPDSWKNKYNGVVRKYNTDKAAWDKGKCGLEKDLADAHKQYLDQMNCNTTMGQNLQKALADKSHLIHDVGELLSMLETSQMPKISEVASVLIFGGAPVMIPCSGGGSVSSHDGWDGRKKDEDDYLFRLRCWLHAGKTVKKACGVRRSSGSRR